MKIERYSPLGFPLALWALGLGLQHLVVEVDPIIVAAQVPYSAVSFDIWLLVGALNGQQFWREGPTISFRDGLKGGGLFLVHLLICVVVLNVAKWILRGALSQWWGPLLGSAGLLSYVPPYLLLHTVGKQWSQTGARTGQ